MKAEGWRAHGCGDQVVTFCYCTLIYSSYWSYWETDSSATVTHWFSFCLFVHIQPFTNSRQQFRESTISLADDGTDTKVRTCIYRYQGPYLNGKIWVFCGFAPNIDISKCPQAKSLLSELFLGLKEPCTDVLWFSSLSPECITFISLLKCLHYLSIKQLTFYFTFSVPQRGYLLKTQENVCGVPVLAWHFLLISPSDTHRAIWNSMNMDGLGGGVVRERDLFVPDSWTPRSPFLDPRFLY